MNLLIIFPRFPWPLKDGGALAFYASMLGFKQKGCTLTIAVLNTSKHRIVFDELPANIKALGEFHLIAINNEITAKGAFKNLFENNTYILSRFYHTAFVQVLKQLIQKQPFDAILFESLQTTVYLDEVKSVSKTPCVYRAHNIEYKIWETQLLIEKNPIKKWYLTIQSKRLAQYEKKVILKFDGLLPISNPDRIIFSQLGVEKPMQVMSAGIDIHRFKSITPNNSGAIFHLGSMDWMPNQEAVSWFLQEVWPGLHKQLPSARFHYAGRNMPERFKANDTVGVKAFGEVEDAYAFMQQQGIMVVPLFSGSGMRVKVIEGMALGKCMVSTKTGMEGVDAVAGKHYFEANTAVEFISTLVMLLVQPEKAVNVGLEARKFAFENYNNDTIIENSIVFLKSLKS